MESPLNDSQRRIASHRIMFDDLLSREIQESLLRASLAGSENGRHETGVIEFFCGLYLQFEEGIGRHFRGDFAGVLDKTFFKHRFGRKGLVPEVMGGATSSGEVFYTIHYSDDVLQLLWMSMRLANAVGKKPFVSDVVAAVAMNRAWTDELKRNGLEPSWKMADFESEVGTVLFYAAVHTGEHWPRQMEFEHNGAFHPPFTLEVCTPSGRFQPVQVAKVKLNGEEIAEIASPEKPAANVRVELLKLNKIEFELEGPQFGSIDVIIRGTPA
jgi:hypothetical protein